MTTSAEPPPSAPKRREFYAAVEAVLAEWNFPMARRRLCNTVMERLGPGCTTDFFGDNIAQIPDGRQYEPVPGRNAYMSKGWGGDGSDEEKKSRVEARLDAELLRTAVELLRRDGKEHKMTDLFEAVVGNDRLSDFFRAGSPNDKARFSGLFTDEVLAASGIKKVCGRPITFQYQG